MQGGTRAKARDYTLETNIASSYKANGHGRSLQQTLANCVLAIARPILEFSPGLTPWAIVSAPLRGKTQNVSFNPSCMTRLLPEPTSGLPAATSGVAHPQPNVLEVPMSLVPPEAPP
jgi:hypothetical protein